MLAERNVNKMAQELHIVKCFKCVTYQVDIVKKAKKWSCKMCGEKQTLKQVFGRGSGTECRKLVQKLNMKKKEFEQMAHSVVQKIVNQEIDVSDLLLEQTCPKDSKLKTNQNITDQPKSTKWEMYVDIPEDLSDGENLLIQPQVNNYFNPKRVYKRKSYTPELTASQDHQPKVPTPVQTTTLFNWNKKSKFEIHTLTELSQDIEKKPKISKSLRPKLLNPNSKWGNFLHSSDEEY